VGKGHRKEKLGLKETANLSFHFCLLWVSCSLNRAFCVVLSL
jgi:solute carrier family 35 protein F5